MKAETITASVDGEYPLASSQRSSPVTGPFISRKLTARRTKVRASKRVASTLPMQPPRQEDGKGYFIQLLAFPISCSIHPEVLGKAPVFFLPRRQIDQHSCGRLYLTGCEQAHGALHHVSCPHEMVPALALLHRSAPRPRGLRRTL